VHITKGLLHLSHTLELFEEERDTTSHDGNEQEFVGQREQLGFVSEELFRGPWPLDEDDHENDCEGDEQPDCEGDDLVHRVASSPDAQRVLS
jgi:hypothetical protein